jgi:hypothetical protein
MTNSKSCFRCKLDLPLTEFYPASANKDGLMGTCKACRSLYQKARYVKDAERNRQYANAYRKDNPDTVRETKRRHYQQHSVRNNHLNRARKYGLTIEELDDLILRYNSVCPICGANEKLYIDHDHETNEVRGMLCNNCNRKLGWVDKVRLEKVASYLRKD